MQHTTVGDWFPDHGLNLRSCTVHEASQQLDFREVPRFTILDNPDTKAWIGDEGVNKHVRMF